MVNTALRTFKIFISSPGDVASEREVASKVIELLNEFYEQTNYPVRLSTLSWEKNTYPDAGLPQEVIKRQIPIQECDILIGIFWKRFGTPTKTLNPTDHKPYLSGTEQEITEAFQQRQQTGDRRPVIMLYRKTEPVSPTMTPAERSQYNRVHKFFDECAPGKKHPALIREFNKDTFTQTLFKDLSRAVNKIDHDQSTIVSKDLKQQANTVSSTDNVEYQKWLQMWGLQSNPFEHDSAEQEPKNSKFFSAFTAIKGEISGTSILEDPTPWFFVGETGSGKTTLRKYLVQHADSKQMASRLPCLEFDQSQLERLLSKTDRISDFINTFIRSLYEELSGPNFNPRKWRSRRDPDEILSRFSSDLKSLPTKHFLCLIEISSEKTIWKGREVLYSSLLDQILLLASAGSVHFRLFLSQKVAENTFLFSQTEKRRLIHIEWDENSIRNMLSRRLTLSSTDQMAPYRSIDELFENFPRPYDTNISARAENNPRNAILLANHLLKQAWKDDMTRALEMDVKQSRMEMIKPVLDAIETIQAKNSSAMITFWGSKGIGKTTLLMNISSYLRKLCQVDLFDVIDVASQSLEEIKNCFQEIRVDLYKQKILVIFLDNLDNLLWKSGNSEAFFEFEQEIILPLLEHGNFLFINTSRTELIQWRESSVRLLQTNFQIPPLSIDDVAAMFSNGRLAGREVYDLTFGQPKVSSWLLEKPTLTAAEIANSAYEYFMEDVPENARAIAGIICFMPIFNPYLLKKLMSENKGIDNSIQYFESLERIKEFIRRGIVFWDVDGYYRFTDSAVRRLLARHFSHSDPARYSKIHGIASEHFMAGARSPGYLHVHLVSAIYHLAHTQKSKGRDRIGEACIAWLRENIDSGAWPSARWEDVRTAWVQGGGEYSVVEELKDLIGDSDFEQITQLLKQNGHEMEDQNGNDKLPLD